MFMVVTDRLALRPVRVGAEIASTLGRLYGAKYELEAAARLFGWTEGLAAFAPAMIRPPPPHHGPPRKHAGGCCGRSTSSTDSC